MKNLQSLLQAAAKRETPMVSVAVAQDAHVLEAVDAAYKAGIANFTLVGDESAIQKIADEHNINTAQFTLINKPDPAEACAHAVSLVASGAASALMKGLVDTSVVMRAAMDRENGIRTGSKLSHVAVFEVPTYHKLLFVTDAAINIAPDFDTKVAITQNAIDAVTNLGITNPKVALLAAKEKADEKMPVTMEWVALLDSGRLTGATVDGPFALDNAVSEESAQIKGINSPVAGDADILVTPNIESGNILYKSLAFLAGGKNGGVVVGAKRPIILTSRADSAESKLLSIALGVLC